MKLRLIVLAGTMAAAASLCACAYDGAYYYGPPVAYADMDYDVWYDGYYGPFYGGYWGPSGRFYYWDQHHMRYHRDAGRHFSRDGMPGYNAVHGHAPPAAGHGRGPSGGRGPH